MKFPSDKYSKVNESFDRWMGPCSDSFCYASCTMATCRWEYRLGDTPAEHNRKLEEMIQDELESCRERLANKDSGQE